MIYGGENIELCKTWQMGEYSNSPR